MPLSPLQQEEKQMAYGIDYRERAMAMMSTGKSLVSISKLLAIGYSTVHRWKTRHEKGQLAAQYPQRGQAYKIDEEKLKAYVSEHPDTYAEEIAVAIGSKRGTVESALKRLNITREKRPRNIGNVTRKSAVPISKR
jgi:transposase